MYLEEMMQVIIHWCNSNEGFTSAVLSAVGLIISIIAIWVSIRTARLPYKKQISLVAGNQIETGLYSGKVITRYRGISVSATNLGNAVCNIQFVGLAIKKDGKLQKLYPVNRSFHCNGILNSMESIEVEYHAEELLGCLVKESKNMKVYAFAQDVAGKMNLKKVGNVGKIVEGMQSANFETMI